MKRSSLFIVILLTLWLGSTAIGQEKTMRESFNHLAGKYNVVFTNLSKNKVSGKIEAKLTLIPTSENDVSPRTGEKASADEDRRMIPFYGWINTDLKTLGIPVVTDSIEPLPNSKDPIYPGVLVLVPGPPIAGKAGFVLTISTLSNLRNGDTYLDGSGIGMKVDEININGFSGTWGPWGIVRTGHGTFEARKIE